MEHPRLIRLPLAWTEPTTDVLGELEAAIDAVAAGAIRRISLVAMPGVEEVAPSALAYAQGAGVVFSLTRDTGNVTVYIGPREA